MAEPVFINGRFLTQPLSGVQRYAGEIVRALDQRPDAADRYRLLLPKGARPPALERIPVSQIGGAGSHLWEQTALAWAARRGVLLSLCGSGPLMHPRQVVVIHDAAVFRRPGHFRTGYALFHRAMGRALARRARLATVSEFSRRELAVVLDTSAAKITVAPNGADHLARVAPDDAVIDRLGLRGLRYFVALGNRAPNKNIGLIVRALARLPEADIRLVLIGGQSPVVFGHAGVTHDSRVMLAGRCTDAETQAVLQGACALVFPSLYEGFGIPPLEAFASDCPVIASDIPAVREVCADAALYIDPTDDAGLAAQMDAMLRGAAPDLRHAGHARAGAYRWERSAGILDALAASI